LTSPESLALSAAADGVVYVLDGEKSNQAYAVQIRKELHNLGVRLLGAVVNRIRTRGSAFVYSPVWFQEPGPVLSPAPEPCIHTRTDTQEKLYV
jgi:hypothetical protein